MPHPTLNDLHKRFWDNAPDAMKAAVIAGIPLEYSSTITPDGGLRITATTKYPCALIGNTLYFSKSEKL